MDISTNPGAACPAGHVSAGQAILWFISQNSRCSRPASPSEHGTGAVRLSRRGSGVGHHEKRASGQDRGTDVRVPGEGRVHS
jgi:hypothetical protein